MKKTSTVLLAILISFLTSTSAFSLTAELQHSAVISYERYIEEVEKKMATRLNHQKPHLLFEQEPSSLKAVRAGKLLINKQKSSRIKAENAIIHEWIGIIFIDGVTPGELSAFLTDYDNHSKIYPEVLESKILNQNDSKVDGFLRIKKQTGPVTAVFNTTHQAQVHFISNELIQVRSKSIDIREIREFQKPKERELPEGNDSGYLWRLNSYWNLKRQDKGTYAELNVVTLSRDVPAALFWIKPFLNSVPKESIQSTLLSTRDGIHNFKKIRIAERIH